jgi:hypothetical protein
VADKLTDDALKAIRDGCEGVPKGDGWVHYRAKLRPNFGGIINEVQSKRKPRGGQRTRPIVAWGGFDSNDRTEAENAVIAAHIARCDPATIRSAFTELLELRDRKEEWRRVQGMIMLCGEEECGDAEDAVTRLRNLIDGLIDRKREIAAKDAETERLTKEKNACLAVLLADGPPDHQAEVLCLHNEKCDALTRAHAAEARVAELEGENTRLREDLR